MPRVRPAEAGVDAARRTSEEGARGSGRRGDRGRRLTPEGARSRIRPEPGRPPLPPGWRRVRRVGALPWGCSDPPRRTSTSPDEFDERTGEPACPVPVRRRAGTRRSWRGASRRRPCSEIARRACATEVDWPAVRPHSRDWLLRPHPLPGAAVSAARVEQLASRLSSADESVATRRRFQPRVARVSHGLGSPSRSSVRPHSSRVPPERVRRLLGEAFPAGEPPITSPASPPQRVAMGRAAASLPGFPAPSRPPAEAVTADDALPAKSVRSQES
jgi:hypothetical protein